MLALDPLKLALVAVVALVVLGPDKLPALARRAGSLLSDLERVRAALHEQARQVVEGLPPADELPGTGAAVHGAVAQGGVDLRRSAPHLLRAAAPESTVREPDPAGSSDPVFQPALFDALDPAEPPEPAEPARPADPAGPG